MEFSSPGLILGKSENLDLERWIISQNINDGRGIKNLTSIVNGRRNLIEYSNTLPDNLLRDIDEHYLERIQQHLDTCYSRYKRKSHGANEKTLVCSVSSSNSAENEEQDQETCQSSNR